MASEEALRTAFRAWDKNGDGYIVPSEIREVLKSAGVPEEKLDKMTAEILAKTDTNHDERISFEEFKGAMASFASLGR